MSLIWWIARNPRVVALVVVMVGITLTLLGFLVEGSFLTAFAVGWDLRGRLDWMFIGHVLKMTDDAWKDAVRTWAARA